MTRTERSLSLAAVLTTAFGVGVTMGMATPLVSLMLEKGGHSSVIIGLVAATYSAGLFAVGPLVPALARRIGPSAVMLAGLVLSAAALALFPIVAPLALLFVLRAFIGVGGALDWIVSETWVGSLVEERSRGRVVGLYATVWGGGLALGPAILSFVGTEGPRPFMVAACTLLAAGVPVVLARRIAPRVNGGQAGGMLLESLRVAPVVMGAAFVCGLAETAFVSLYPVYGLEHGFTEPVVVLQISIGAAGSLALQQPFGWLADKLDRRWLLVAVSAIASACTLAIPLVLETWAIWPVVFLLGGAIAGFYTLGLVLLGQRFAEGDLAGANTAFIMSYTLGMVVGPVVAGSSMRLVPDHGLVLTLAGFFVAFFAWTLADRLARHD